jgi:hypothetical protein
VTGEASGRAKTKIINELVLTLACLPVLQLEIIKNPKKNYRASSFSFTNTHNISSRFSKVPYLKFHFHTYSF